MGADSQRRVLTPIRNTGVSILFGMSWGSILVWRMRKGSQDDPQIHGFASAMGFPWRAVWSRADPRSGGSGVEGQRGGTGIEGKGDRRGTGVVQDQLTHPKAKQGAPGTRAKRGLQGPRGEQSSSRSRQPGEKSRSFCPPLGV